MLNFLPYIGCLYCLQCYRVSVVYIAYSATVYGLFLLLTVLPYIGCLYCLECCRISVVYIAYSATVYRLFLLLTVLPYISCLYCLQCYRVSVVYIAYSATSCRLFISLNTEKLTNVILRTGWIRILFFFTSHVIYFLLSRLFPNRNRSWNCILKNNLNFQPQGAVQIFFSFAGYIFFSELNILSRHLACDA